MSKKNYVGPYLDRCSGATDSNQYVVVFNIAGAKVKKIRQDGLFSGLEKINAFDLAENEGAYMGQVNAITVSSFCGQDGYVWGHHLAKVNPNNVIKPIISLLQWDGMKVPVYDGNLLLNAAKKLFGTSDNKRFPLAPGTLCPMACKTISIDHPGHIYATVAIGITEDDDSACMLMEDAGEIDVKAGQTVSAIRENAITAVSESVLKIAKNQRVKCKMIYASFIEIEVKEGEVGCCGIFIPYIKLAKNVIPSGGIKKLHAMTIDEWEQKIIGNQKK